MDGWPGWTDGPDTATRRDDDPVSVSVSVGIIIDVRTFGRERETPTASEEVRFGSVRFGSVRFGSVGG